MTQTKFYRVTGIIVHNGSDMNVNEIVEAKSEHQAHLLAGERAAGGSDWRWNEWDAMELPQDQQMRLHGYVELL